MDMHSIYRTAGRAAGIAGGFSALAFSPVALAVDKISLDNKDGGAMVKEAIGVEGVNAETIMGWIQNLTTFLLVVYVLLIVAAIIIGAILIGTSAEKDDLEKNNPLYKVLGAIPFIGPVAQAQIKGDKTLDLLQFAKGVLMETFKTTLVIVLAWVIVTVIIQVALFVGNNAQSVVS
jgi:hypothetical protein